MSKPIDMTGVKRWKVRDKESWEILGRFHTYQEAEEYKEELEDIAKLNHRTLVIVWD